MTATEPADFRDFRDFRWDAVEHRPYKEDASAAFSAISRQVLFEAPALRAKDCPPELRRAFERVRQTLQTAARAITFQQLLEESTEKEKMYYI